MKILGGLRSASAVSLGRALQEEGTVNAKALRQVTSACLDLLFSVCTWGRIGPKDKIREGVSRLSTPGLARALQQDA